MARTRAKKVHEINLEALKDESVLKKFADSISLKLHHLQTDLPLQVNEHWNKCAEIINSAATTHLKMLYVGTRTCDTMKNAKRFAVSKKKRTIVKSERTHTS